MRRCCRGIAARRRFIARSSPASRRPASRSCASCKALDAGPMLATVRRPIGPDETSAEVERESRASWAQRCSSRPSTGWRAGPVDEEPQDDALATYAHRLTKEDGLIDWSQPAQRVHDLDSRPASVAACLFTFLDGRRLILLRSVGRRSEPVPTCARHHPRWPAATSLLWRPDRGAILVQRAPGRRQTADGGRATFLAGHPLSPGERFTSCSHDRAGARRRLRDPLGGVVGPRGSADGTRAGARPP